MLCILTSFRALDFKIDGLKEVDQWLPFVNEFEPEIKILVCDRCAIEEGDQQRYSKYDGTVAKKNSGHNLALLERDVFIICN